jgi:hypothetical protein
LTLIGGKRSLDPSTREDLMAKRKIGVSATLSIGLLLPLAGRAAS